MINENLTSFAGKPVHKFTGENPVINPDVAVKIESLYDEEPLMPETLQKLIDTGLTDQIETMVFGQWNESWEAGPDFIEFMINNKDKFPNLKHIFTGDMTYMQCEMSWIIQANYNDFLKAYPKLESFAAQGGENLRFGKFSLPNLKEFTIWTGGLAKETLNDLILSDTFQNVEKLEIWLGTENYNGTCTIEEIKALLDLDIPNLKHLGLMNSDMQDDVVKLLATHPITQQLKTLNISMGILTDEGAKHLLNDGFDHIEKIYCEHHYMSENMMKDIVIKLQDRIELSESEGEDDEYKYVSIGE